MIGTEIKKLLVEKGVSFADLARHLNVSRQNIDKKLDSPNENLSFNRQVSEYLNIPITDLIGTPQPEREREPEPDLSTTVNEPNFFYQSKSASGIDYKAEMTKVFTENVQLHRTVAERGELIIKLLAE